MFIAAASDQSLEPRREGGGGERKTERGRERHEGNKRVGGGAEREPKHANQPLAGIHAVVFINGVCACRSGPLEAVCSHGGGNGRTSADWLIPHDCTEGKVFTYSFIHPFIHSPAAACALNTISRRCQWRRSRKQEVDAKCCGARRHIHREGPRSGTVPTVHLPPRPRCTLGLLLPVRLPR